jgi:cytochrome c oxidase subunit 2
MRRLLLCAVLLALPACTLFDPPGQRFVVYFEPFSADIDAPAGAVVTGAAQWANAHPMAPVVVAAYADPTGSAQANADLTRLRAQVVSDGLVHNGVAAIRIRREDIGPVPFKIDSQESRRVLITVGTP